MKSIVVAVGFLLVLFSGAAEAKRHKHLPQINTCRYMCDSIYAMGIGAPLPTEGRKRNRYKPTPRPVFDSVQAAPAVRGFGPRPGRWCGWWMRVYKGIADPALNLARNWASVGSNAGGPAVGAVVVWRSHVGVITGKAADGKWVVKSGNDGGRVRERPRSVAGAIAFRTI